MTRGQSGRRLLAAVALCGVTLGALAANAPRAAAAEGPSGPAPVLIDVQGGPVASLTATPLALSPAFSPSTFDYVLRCATGANQVTLTIGAASGETVAYGTPPRSTVTAAITLVEGQAAVVQSDVQGPQQQYWIRCLPNDFPPLDVNRPGSPAPGWYLTGTISGGNTGAPPDGRYAMILDGNGTPVWYAAAPDGADLVQPVTSTSVSYSGLIDPFNPNPGYSIYALDGSSSTNVSADGFPTDNHELLLLPNGNRAVIAYPLKQHVDLSNTPGVGQPDQTIVDCVIQELNPAGTAIWSWTASDHMGLDESLHASKANNNTAWDVFHCNSIDEDAAANVLVSMRHADAVVDIDRNSGAIVWKLGGSTPDNASEKHLSITGDPAVPEGPSGQHDARFEPGGKKISLYDDQTFTKGPTSVARGLVYALDLGSATATFDAQYLTPLNRHALFTGSFRPYSDGSNVVGWGGLPGGSGFTDFDSNGNIQLAVAFPHQDLTYRALKAPLQMYDAGTLRRTAGMNIQPPPVLQPPPTPPPPPAPQAPPAQPAMGYWLAGADGGVFPIGNRRGFGSTGDIRLNRPMVGIAATPDDGGYWLVASDGGIFPFGDAGGYGSTGNIRLNAPIVGMAAPPDGGGYWLVATDGGIFPFGDAGGFGSTGNIRLNRPVVGMASTPDGGGYWLVAADGGIFPFGDARGYGSTGNVRLNSPIVGMASTPDGGGYWLVASDGGIFPFGDATGFGSMGGVRLNSPIVGMVTSPDGGGYWLAGGDGGIFPFGDAVGYGSLGATRLNKPMVGIAA